MQASRVLVVICGLLPILVLTGEAAADTRQSTVSGSGVSAPEVVPGASPIVTPTTQALVTTSLSAKSEGAQFRATIVPLRAVDLPYVPVFSEGKLSFLSDTANSSLQSSLTFAYNPFALRDRRGAKESIAPIGADGGQECPKTPEELLKQLAKGETVCGEHEALYACALKSIEALKAENDEAQTALDNAQLTYRSVSKALFDTVAPTPPIPGSVEPEKWTEAVKIWEENVKKWRAVRVELLNQLANAEHSMQAIPSEMAKRRDLIKKLTKPDDVQKETDKCVRRKLANQWHEINGTVIPMIGITGFVTTFPFGRGPDPKDSSGLTSADFEPWGGAGLQPFLSFHLDERLSVDVYASWKRARASGDAHTLLARTIGGGATIAWEFHSFLTIEELEKNDEYIQSGFIPGLVIGASGQYTDCNGREQCPKLRTVQQSVTPFFDVRASSKLQVRFSTPLLWYSSTDKAGKDIAPTLSLAGQFSSL
jgi:hypothetical protein